MVCHKSKKILENLEIPRNTDSEIPKWELNFWKTTLYILHISICCIAKSAAETLPHLLYVDELDVVGEFGPDLERCVAGRTEMRSILTVILEVSSQSTPGRVLSRTQSARIPRDTYSHKRT